MKISALKGMTNLHRDTAIPDGYLYNAVNVQFTNEGDVIFPRTGSTVAYSGVCKWVFKTPIITLFVESGSLKKLNNNNTATVIMAGVGNNRMVYTIAGDAIYFSNGTKSGKFLNNVGSEWGVARPARQPDCAGVASGGLYGGEYRVAITFFGTDGNESGTGMGRRVTVADGGGIHLSNFPIPPSYCTGIGVYVSPVNGADMLLYGEYPASLSTLTISQSILAIPLTTQFKYPPLPKDIITAHYGRIYYALGNKLYWTADRNYSLQEANSYWAFSSDVKVIVSRPNVLYIGTLTDIYSIRNIDSVDAPIIVPMTNTGTTKGSEYYDPNGDDAYFYSDRGIIKATEQGLEELTYATNALPHFDTGTMTVTEENGLRYLTFVGQGATQSKLADSSYNAAEITRGSL